MPMHIIKVPGCLFPRPARIQASTQPAQRATLETCAEPQAALPEIVDRHRAQIAEITSHLADSVGSLRRLNRAMLHDIAAVEPGHPDEAILIGLKKTYDHVSQAVADVPAACWAAMVTQESSQP